MRILGINLLGAVAICAVLGATPARASGDEGCVPDFASLASGFSCDVRGALIPSNDTRDNLIFLMADRQKQKLTEWPVKTEAESSAYYGYGEGTICVSEASGGEGFLSAITAETQLSADERQALQKARQDLKCEAEGAAPAVFTMQSAAGKDFAAYHAAVEEFYHGNYTDPTRFVPLATASQPWVKEAARYMQARIALLAAQASAFDDYGTLDRTRINQAMVTAARDALNAYLKDYPQGAYADSATGLLRRADWLSGDPAVLAATYSKAATSHPVDLAGVNLANEIDTKLPVEAYTDAAADPILLAVQDLRLLRPQTDANGNPAPGMTAEFLEAQRGRFAGHETLFDYLLAARAWHVDHDAAAVLKILGDTAPTGPQDYLGFSRQILRAAALQANGGDARPLYLSLVPLATALYQGPTLQLELAKYDERHKNISAVFEEGSPVTDPDIRIRVLDHVAGPIILKMQATSDKVTAKERNAALYRLLVRDLLQGRFKGFLEDIKLMPAEAVPDPDSGADDIFASLRWEGGSDDGYECPNLVEIATRLAAKPTDVKGRLCLGDFIRENYVVPIEPVAKDDLGGTGTLFAGKDLARQDFYRDIARSKTASREDRAYALFRAVHCYESVGDNDCGGEAVDVSERRKWFKELKSKYADTDWAKQLDIYW